VDQPASAGWFVTGDNVVTMEYVEKQMLSGEVQRHTVIFYRTINRLVAVTVSGCATPGEARREAWKEAEKNGWTPPRWWQWWRSAEERPPSW
jgi:hypothetical protein